MVDTTDRPEPEALLSELKRASRGRLKIFLGAAPGVGKTYEMLSSAQRRKLDGVDIVVGIVETHGRRETAALLAGLEVLPRRRVPYRGRELEEMDLASVAAEIMYRFAPSAAQLNCSLELHAPMAVVGRWDRLRLEQVVTNLLSNALKYGAGQPVYVRVEAEGRLA